MITLRSTIKIPNVEFDRYELMLAQNHPAEKCGDIIKTFTAEFPTHPEFEVDIKVCNGAHNPWVDAILFLDGCEYVVLEPEFTLSLPFIFEFELDTEWYRIRVEVRPQNEHCVYLKE